jgi:hypothetical protein
LDLNGRKLVLLKAMSRNKLTKKVEEQQKNDDKRNLNILKNGLVNTKDFTQPDTVSEIDMEARIRLWKEK